MQIDPSQLPAVYRDAHADLVPRTPLKDMEVDIWPGRALGGPPGLRGHDPDRPDDLPGRLGRGSGRAGHRHPGLAREPDRPHSGRPRPGGERHALAAPRARADRRPAPAGGGPAGRPASASWRSSPTTSACSCRRPAPEDVQLGQVVRASDGRSPPWPPRTWPCAEAVTLLPGTLEPHPDHAAAPDGVRPRARPGLDSADAGGPRAAGTLRRSEDLFRGAALLPLRQIKPFVQAALPLARKLPPLARDLKIEVPDLIDAFKVLAYSTNELAYNPRGQEPWLPVLAGLVCP